MPKYINADSLLDWVKRQTNPYGKPTLDYKSGLSVIRMIKKERALGVDLVTCENCKYLMRHIVTEETPYGFDENRYVFGCRKFFELSGEWVDVMLDDYCSRGERMDESATDTNVGSRKE